MSLSQFQTGQGRSGMRVVFRAGAFAAIAMLVIMAAQIVIFVIWPPPQTAGEMIALFNQNAILGLLSMDFLYLINNGILVLIYLPLYMILREKELGWSTIAIIFGLVGIAAYYASNTSFEMLAISRQFAAAGTDAQRAALLGAGHAMIAVYKGTAFNVYYVLNAITLLIFAVMIVRGNVFSKSIGVTGLIAGILMTIPSTAGTLGMIFALASLVPWAVFLVLLIPHFFSLSRD